MYQMVILKKQIFIISSFSHKEGITVIAATGDRWGCWKSKWHGFEWGEAAEVYGAGVAVESLEKIG